MSFNTNDEVEYLKWLMQNAEYHYAADDSDIDFYYIPIELIKERMDEIVEVRHGEPRPLPSEIPEPYIWTTAAGQEIPVTEMENGHLVNTIKYLRRMLASKPDPYAYGEPDGDAAQDAFNAEIRHNEALPEAYEAALEAMEEELERRSN